MLISLCKKTLRNCPLADSDLVTTLTRVIMLVRSCDTWTCRQRVDCMTVITLLGSLGLKVDSNSVKATEKNLLSLFLRGKQHNELMRSLLNFAFQMVPQKSSKHESMSASERNFCIKTKTSLQTFQPLSKPKWKRMPISPPQLA